MKIVIKGLKIEEGVKSMQLEELEVELSEKEIFGILEDEKHSRQIREAARAAEEARAATGC